MSRDDYLSQPAEAVRFPAVTLHERWRREALRVDWSLYPYADADGAGYDYGRLGADLAVVARDHGVELAVVRIREDADHPHVLIEVRGDDAALDRFTAAHAYAEEHTR